jgi:hypothetical protein
MLADTIFEEQERYLNNTAGINYAHKGKKKTGWKNASALFCDNIILWCATHILLAKKSTEIGLYIGIVRAVLSRYFTTDQYKISYLYSGACKDDATIKRSMHKRKERELGMEGYEGWYLAIKVSFENTPFVSLIPTLATVLAELKRMCVVLHDMDIAMDCAYISSRSIIENYILGKGIQRSDIVKDRHSVGDNCISWYSKASDDLSIRTKVYNKFVQMLESCDLRSSIGSQLNYLVSNPDAALLERLQKYVPTGMSRIELTIYSPKIKTVDDYRSIMDKTLGFLKVCPTFKVSFEKHWQAIVDKLQQMTAVYIRDKKVFAYCHWWNSITKRKQGLVKSGVPISEVKTLLANLGFNDRPIHYLLVESTGEKSYRMIKHKVYMREKGCTAITLVPGISNSLYPFRAELLHDALSFECIGLSSFQNVTIEWPETRLRRDRNGTLARIVRVKKPDAFDLSALRDTIDLCETPKVIQYDEVIQMSKYKPDYQVLKPGTTYAVSSFGYGVYRGKQYLCLTLDEATHVRCSPGMSSVALPLCEELVKFQIRFIRAKKIQGSRDIECEIVV